MFNSGSILRVYGLVKNFFERVQKTLLGRLSGCIPPGARTSCPPTSGSNSLYLELDFSLRAQCGRDVRAPGVSGRFSTNEPDNQASSEMRLATVRGTMDSSPSVIDCADS